MARCGSCGGGGGGSRAGATRNNAIVFGEPEPEVIRVTFLQSAGGQAAGATKYVRGSGVQELIDTGVLAQLSGNTYTLPERYSKTLYYVGDVGFSSMNEARVRSGQTGEEIVVRSFG
jgi:hypothetical protein